jgi:hypothetical protein
LATGDREDRYSFHGDYLVHNTTFFGGENFDELIYKRSWEFTPGLRNMVVDDDGSIFGLSSNKFIFLSLNSVISNEIIGETQLTVLGDSQAENSISEYVNTNHSVDVIFDEDGDIILRRLSYSGEAIVPELNNFSPHVHSVYDGQVFNEGNWVNCTQNQSTVVFYDEFFPAVGDPTSEEWFNTPDSLEFVMSWPVDYDEYGTFARFAFKKYGSYDDYVFMKVILEKESDVITTGAKEEEASDVFVSVYPNPARDFINISSRQNISAVKIYNLMGEEIFSKKGNFSTEAVVDISGYENAVYYLVVLGENNATSIRKIIKY